VVSKLILSPPEILFVNSRYPQLTSVKTTQIKNKRKLKPLSFSLSLSKELHPSPPLATPSFNHCSSISGAVYKPAS
jgi:hypothetical protein